MDYTVRKLTDHASANCRVRVYDNGDLVLQSYATDVIYYQQATGRVFCTGTYSQTTRKHIGWFLREYPVLRNLSYQDMRNSYDSDHSIDVSGKFTVPLTKIQLATVHGAHNGARLYPGCL